MDIFVPICAAAGRGIKKTMKMDAMITVNAREVVNVL
jgi:hypothetical protein